MTAVRAEVVSLLLDVGPLDHDQFRNRTMRHEDGRPVTDAEYTLIGSALLAEVQACADFSRRASEWHQEVSADLTRAVEIMEPYFERLGPDSTAGDVRKIVTEEEGAFLDMVFEREVTLPPLAQEVLPRDLWLLLPGNRAVKAHEYDAAVHGPLANCWNCKQPTELCSWAAIDGDVLAAGDCCTECQHESTGP